MADQDRNSAGMTHDQTRTPVPATPSEKTERPEGLAFAFDVEKGTEMPGVPTGDQHPRNTGTAPAHESGDGVGLAVPGDETAGKDLPAK